jgi:hypothetical protein
MSTEKMKDLMDWLEKYRNNLLEQMPWVDDEDEEEDYDKDEDDYMNEGALETIEDVIRYVKNLTENFEEEKIDSEVLDYIAEHNSDPSDFLWAIMHEADLTDEEALSYLMDSFGYKNSEEDLREIIAEYRE